jgi:hypothetical protein
MERVQYSPRAACQPGRGEGSPCATRHPSNNTRLSRVARFGVLAFAVAGMTACADEEPLAPEMSESPTAAMAVALSYTAITSRHAANMCLAIENGLAILAPCNGGTAQQFVLESNNRIRLGNLCLSTQRESGPEGDRVVAAGCSGGTNQNWTVSSAGEIRGINDYCVDVYAESRSAGARIVVWSCHGGTNQKWSLDSGGPVSTDSPPQAVASRHAANMCLAIENGLAILASCNGGAAQQFAPQSDGRMRFGELCLATRDGSGPIGDRVTVGACSSAANQQWSANSAGEIRGIHGYCLDIYAERTTTGSAIVVWPCHGGSNQRWSITDPTPPPPPTVSRGGADHRGTVLFAESFDNANLTSRGWYDVDPLRITTAERAPGSAASFECRFAAGANECSGGVPGRHEFTGLDQIYVSYWVKYQSGWVGSGRPYHPHEIYLLNNLDGRYAGPAYSRMALYVEQVGGRPQIAMQDAANVDPNCILRNDNVLVGCNGHSIDTYPFGEARSAAACNGLRGPVDGRDCYSLGGGRWYSMRNWKAQANVADGSWHFVESYIRLNSISGGRGLADGVIRQWVDGARVLDVSGVLLRTGEHSSMRINQLLFAPYIGNGSPIAQSVWYDELTVAAGRQP